MLIKLSRLSHRRRRKEESDLDVNEKGETESFIQGKIDRQKEGRTCRQEDRQKKKKKRKKNQKISANVLFILASVMNFNIHKITCNRNLILIF